MAHPNEDLVRRGYDAFSQGDVETLRQLFADDTIFHEPGRNPVSGDYQGIDQVLGFFGMLAERSGGTFRVTLHDAVASDEHAVGVHVSEGERRGAGFAASRQLCSTCAMAGSRRRGRSTMTSMQLTSSGRRHPRITGEAYPVWLVPPGRIAAGRLGSIVRPVASRPAP